MAPRSTCSCHHSDVGAAATQHADPTLISQGESGRPADPLCRAELSHAEALAVDEAAETTMTRARLPGEWSGLGAGLRCAEKYVVRVLVDPSAMATRQIGIDDVSNALNQEDPDHERNHELTAEYNIT